MTISTVSSENPSREFSNLMVILGTPKIATDIKCKDSSGDSVLRFCRLANSAYLKKKNNTPKVRGRRHLKDQFAWHLLSSKACAVHRSIGNSLDPSTSPTDREPGDVL